MNSYLGSLFAVISFFAFSVMDATNRFVLTSHVISFPIYFTYVKVFTLILMLTFGLLVYRNNFFAVKNKKFVGFRSILLTINTVSTTLAVSYLPLDIFYALVFLMPLITTLMGTFMLQEKFTIYIGVILLAGFIGTIVIIKPLLNSEAKIIGIILTFVTIFTGSLSGIVARKYLPHENAFSATFYALICALGVGFIMSLSQLRVESFHIPSSNTIFLIALSATSTIIGATFFMKAFQNTKAHIIAPIQYTQMIWGILFGYLLFRNETSITTIVGCLIIVFSTVVNIYLGNKKNA